MATHRLDRSTTALLVVDLQEKLIGHIHNHEQVLERSSALIQCARKLSLPIAVTEQYCKGLGPTVPVIEQALASGTSPDLREEKMRFSACIEPVERFLTERKIRTVLVCGIEAHVCVLQSCLDLLDKGSIVATAMDAIGSRRRIDHHIAVERMRQAGVVPVTVESAIFELVQEAGTEEFKGILKVLK
jgi:nicotinamidase-related amidase